MAQARWHEYQPTGKERDAAYRVEARWLPRTAYTSDSTHLVVESVREREMRGGYENGGYYWDRVWTTVPSEEWLVPGRLPNYVPIAVRRVIAGYAAKAGYVGPFTGPEARCLRNLLTQMNRTDCIGRGYVEVTKSVKTRTRGRYRWTRELTTLVGPVWLFRSPVEGVTMQQFVMLARMYRDRRGMRRAVLALLSRPAAEIAAEVETFAALNILAR